MCRPPPFDRDQILRANGIAAVMSRSRTVDTSQLPIHIGLSIGRPPPRDGDTPSILIAYRMCDAATPDPRQPASVSLPGAAIGLAGPTISTILVTNVAIRLRAHDIATQIHPHPTLRHDRFSCASATSDRWPPGHLDNGRERRRSNGHVNSRIAHPRNIAGFAKIGRAVEPRPHNSSGGMPRPRCTATISRKRAEG